MTGMRFLTFLATCFCIQLTLEYRQVQGISQEFQLYTGKCEDMKHDIFLKFSKVGFTRLNDDVIESSHASCLSFENNVITDVSLSAFDSLPNLLYLDVSSNLISKSNLFCIGANTDIKTLILDNNKGNINGYYNQPKIMSCDRVFLNLEHLYVRNCDIRTTDMDSLIITAPKLSHVYLSHNAIDSLSFMNWLPPNVTHLYLDGNNIATFSRRINLHKIIHLDLGSNDIVQLSSRYCDGESLCLRSATSLRYLSLAGNKIVNIEPHTFDDMGNLTTLDLSRNRLIAFGRGTFDNLQLLQNLSLSNNSLRDVPDICPLLSSLIHLDLSFNEIKTFSSEFICHTTTLQSIDLNKNMISTISDNAFVNFTALVYLNLAGNPLQTLAPNWIAPLSNLKILHIGGNNFEKLANLHLRGANALTDIYVEPNVIGSFMPGDLLDISNNVSLHFRSSCNCDSCPSRQGAICTYDDYINGRYV